MSIAIKAAKEVNPGAIFLGESYYSPEHNQKLIELGFDYVYEKLLYDSIKSVQKPLEIILKM